MVRAQLTWHVGAGSCQARFPDGRRISHLEDRADDDPASPHDASQHGDGGAIEWFDYSGVSLAGQRPCDAGLDRQIEGQHSSEGTKGTAQRPCPGPCVDASNLSRIGGVADAERRPMNSFFLGLPETQRRRAIEESAVRQNISAVIMEKDFWVCWMLSVLFRCEFGTRWSSKAERRCQKFSVRSNGFRKTLICRFHRSSWICPNRVQAATSQTNGWRELRLHASKRYETA